jgi:hypothetical protein
MKARAIRRMLLAATIAVISLNTQAETVSLMTSNAAGTSWETVGTSSNFTWSDQLAAHSGADYEVGANLLLRTPASSSPATFPGDSLALHGQLNLNVGNNSTTTIHKLSFAPGGVVVNSLAGSTQTLSGSLSVDSGTAFIKGTGSSGAGDNRNVVVAALVSGDSELHFLRRGTFTLTNADNSFSGTWRAGGNGIFISGASPASTTVSNQPGEPTVLRASVGSTDGTTGSLGLQASVVMDAHSVFEPEYDWATTGSLTLNTNSRMILNRIVKVGALTIGGVALADGDYSYEYLAANHGAFFASGGSGRIIVGDFVPKPPGAIPPGPGPGLRLISDSVVTNSGLNFPTGAYGTSMNGQTFQQEALVSHNGYQYAAYFDASKRPAVARRALPNGAWERIVFNDYGPISHTDVHNVNVIGICPEDGTIHLSFDHHVSTMHYRRSVANVATNPAQFAWDQNLFGAITSQLEPGNSLAEVTYPQFFTSPQGKLQFCFRTGSSGNGDWHFYEYSSAGWQRLGMLFSREGNYSGKSSRSAYPNQFRYDREGRIHITWSWREAGSDLTGNHDLGYAHSADFGRIWRSNTGTTIATLNGGAGSANAIKLDTPGHQAYPIRYNWGYMNTTTQAVDAKGRVHVISWRNPDDAPAATTDLNRWRYFHYWRDTDGTWRERRLPFFGRKPQVVLDDAGNMYVIFGQGTDLNYHTNDPGARLSIATATEASGWTDWKTVSDVTGRQYHGEPLLDIGRWERERILSIYYQERPATAGQGSPLRVLDFRPKSERELWNEEQFGEAAADPLMSGDAQAPAGDGVVNLIKFAFGLPAMTPADPQLLPSSGAIQFGAETYLMITFLRRTSRFSGLSYRVLGSDDLTVWAPLDLAVFTVGPPENLGNGFERVTVRAPTPINSSSRYFLKLDVLNTAS